MSSRKRKKRTWKFWLPQGHVMISLISHLRRNTVVKTTGFYTIKGIFSNLTWTNLFLKLHFGRRWCLFFLDFKIRMNSNYFYFFIFKKWLPKVFSIHKYKISRWMSKVSRRSQLIKTKALNFGRKGTFYKFRNRGTNSELYLKKGQNLPYLDKRIWIAFVSGSNSRGIWEIGEICKFSRSI